LGRCCHWRGADELLKGPQEEKVCIGIAMISESMNEQLKKEWDYIMEDMAIKRQA
jgi:hypothetical protein